MVFEYTASNEVYFEVKPDCGEAFVSGVVSDSRRCQPTPQFPALIILFLNQKVSNAAPDWAASSCSNWALWRIRSSRRSTFRASS